MSMERLEEIAVKVNELQAEYRKVITRGVALAREMGTLLIEARAMIPNGRWTHWLSESLDMTPDVAHRYSTIAKNWDRIERHKLFPNLNLIQMFDVARKKQPRSRRYTIAGSSLDTVIEALDVRLSEYVDRYPELAALMDAIDNARPVLEEAGLLKSGVQARLRTIRERKKIA